MNNKKSANSEEETIIEEKQYLKYGMIVMIIWALSFFLLFLEKEQRGVFGDMFGAVNALFSGLAFAGLIVTLGLQRADLKLQREELIETREEVRLQRVEMELQNKTLAMQRFDNTFFNLLSHFNELINSLKLTNNATGRTVFEYLASDLLNFKIQTLDDDKKNLDQLLKHYSLLYKTNIGILSHYFRTLYQIIKFIDESEITNKKTYIGIVRAQLSNNEQILLFVNCLHPNGNEKFKPLIEKYALFKNLDKNTDPNPFFFDDFKPNLYEDGAFESS